MIPKIIHYCWFGRGDKPKLAQKCINSWKEHCPEYEFIEWNEDNFDVNMNGYTKMCISEKKYAFLSDYVRLYVVEQYGGVYFDTDVQLLKPLDALLTHEAFFGFETEQYVATGLGFGSVAHGTAIKAMLDAYECLIDGEHGTVGCPRLNTAALLPFGLRQNGQLQTVAGATILPPEYLNPYDDPTGRLNQTKNTVSIHWYSKSALSKAVILRSKLTRPFHRLFGVDFFKTKKQKSR